MVLKKRLIKNPDTTTLRSATPAILLVASVSAVMPARADQNQQAAANSPDVIPDSAGKIARDDQVAVDHSDSLILPFNTLNKRDTRLLRRILLTHGVHFDLGEQSVFSAEAFARLVDDLRSGDRLNQSVDLELLEADALDLTSTLDLTRVLAEDVMDASAFLDGVSREWHVLWLGDRQAASNDRLALDVAPKDGHAIQDPAQRGSFAVGAPIDGVSSSWHVQEVFVRPATAKELALLNLEADLPREPSTGASESASEMLLTPESTLTDATQSVEDAALIPAPLSGVGGIGFTNGVSAGWSVGSRLATAEELRLLGLLAPAANQSPGSTALPVDATDGLDINLQTANQEEPGSISSSLPLDLVDVDVGSETTANTAAAITEDATADADADAGAEADAEAATATSSDTVSENVDINLGVPPMGLPTSIPGAANQVIPSESGQDSGDDSDGLFAFADDVPAGFEDLASEQVAFVDVYFKERKVGSTTITASAEEFSFDNSAEVLAMLDGIEDPDMLKEPLAQQLPTNAHKICYGIDEPTGCGQVDANPVAAIYDENKLKLELFVAAGLQTIESQQSIKYLPAPERNNTSILSFYAVASDLQGQDDAIDLSGRALFGYGNGNITAEADYNSRSEIQRLRELKLTHFVSDYELVGGTYSFQPGGALSGFDMAGVSFATTFKTRVDLEHAFSTEMVVFLPRRSVVQIAIDDRIYTGESYAAGNQALDTTALPDGTYEVEIRILDPLSGPRTERRVFTKSTQIPPRGQTVFNVTLGAPILFDADNTFAEVTDTKAAGFSFSNRLTDHSALSLGALQFGPYTFLQSDYVYFGKQFSLEIAASVGEDSTLASALRASYFYKELSFNFSSDMFQSERDASIELSPEYDQIYPFNYKQINVSVNRAFQNYSLGLRSGYREEDAELGKQTSNQYAVYYRRPLFRKRGLRGFLDAGYQQDELDRRLTLQFQLFFGGGQWNTLLTSSANRNDQGENGYLFGADTAWSTEVADRYEFDMGLYANSGSDGEAAGARFSFEHPWFTAGAATDVNRTDFGAQSRNSVATVRAHLGVDRRGVGMGGSDFAQAGVIVSVRGEPAGARFDVLVNGTKTSSGQIGKTQFIGLQPFEAYSIKLSPQSVLSNGIGEDVYEFTLYPGTVQRIDIVAQRKVLLIATLVDNDGELIENAVIEREGSPLLIDASGFFQSEVRPGEVLRVQPEQGAECEFTVPESENEEVLVVNDPLHCQEIILDE